MKPINLHITFNTRKKSVTIIKDDVVILHNEEKMDWEEKINKAYVYVCRESIDSGKPVKITENWF